MFGFKLIFLRSGLNAATFWICMDAKFFGISRFNNFHLIGATYTSKISSVQKRLFFANIPFKKWLLDLHPSNPCLIKNQWDILIFLSEIDNLMSSTLLVIYRFKGYHKYDDPSPFTNTEFKKKFSATSVYNSHTRPLCKKSTVKLLEISKLILFS